MEEKFKYSNDTEKENIMQANAGRYLIRIEHLTEGNFLTFTDEPGLQEQVKALKEDNLILMDAMATVFEEILNLQAMQGGTV